MHALIAALAGVLVITSPTKSEACGMRHQTPFELFERAHTVAFATVREVPVPPDKQIAGDVELVVSRVVKGRKTATLVAKESDTSCRAGFVRGTDVLVFLRADGFTVNAFEGQMRDPGAWKPVIDRWSQATDAAARAAVLVHAISGANPKVAEEAITFLLDAPALLNEVTATQTAHIAKAACLLWRRSRLLTAPRRACG